LHPPGGAMMAIKSRFKAAIRKQRGEEGQSTVEFALTLVLLMAFILFFVQVSLMFAWGNYIHYATYMSARAYLAAGPNLEDQQTRARNVIVRMVKKGPAQPGADRLPFVAQGIDGGNPTGLFLDPP